MEPIPLDSSLLLNEKQIAASRSSVARVKKRLHDTELTLILEPPKNERAEREEWRLKVTELIERKEQLPFPNLEEIEEQLDKKEQQRLRLQSRQDENKRRKPKPFLTDEEKLEQVKRIELKRRIDPNCKFFGPSQEGEPIRTIENYAGCNTIYAGSRTLIRRNPKVEVFASTVSSLPPWFGPGYYKNADPKLFSALPESSYQVWVKSEERVCADTATDLREKKIERSVMKNPNARADPPFCTDRLSIKHPPSYMTGVASSMEGSTGHLSSWRGQFDTAGSLASLDSLSVSFKRGSVRSKTTSKKSKSSTDRHSSTEGSEVSVMAATMPTIALNSLVAKIERYHEKHYKTKDYSLGALPLTKAPTADEAAEGEKRLRLSRAKQAKQGVLATATSRPTTPLTAAADSSTIHDEHKFAPVSTMPVHSSTTQRRASALRMGRKSSQQQQKDMTVSAAYLAAEFMRKQRNSLAPDSKRNSSVMGDRKASILSFNDHRMSVLRGALDAHAGAGDAASRRASAQVAATGTDKSGPTRPSSPPPNPEMDAQSADDSPSIITRPKITIDPLGADRDNYSFANANRANPDFYVLHPKSPWLKTRSPAFPKDSQSDFKPYVSPIKNALKKKAMQSTEELLRVAASMRRARRKKQGDMDGDYSEDESDNFNDGDVDGINGGTTVPFDLPHIDEDLRPLVRKWFSDNEVYSPSKPRSLFKASSSLASLAASESLSGAGAAAGSAAGAGQGAGTGLGAGAGMGTGTGAGGRDAGSTAHALAHTWSSVVKAIPKYTSDPTGRSTRALQGTNGLLLGDVQANHLRSELTSGSPEEFQRLINTEIHPPAKDASTSAASSHSQLPRSMSMKPFDNAGYSRKDTLSKSSNVPSGSVRYSTSADEEEEDEEDEWIGR